MSMVHLALIIWMTSEVVVHDFNTVFGSLGILVFGGSNSAIFILASPLN